MDVDLTCADCGLPLGGVGVRRQIVLAGRRNEWENAHGNLQICIERLRAEVAEKDRKLEIAKGLVAEIDELRSRNVALILDTDGRIERLRAEVAAMRDALRLAADEPNIDKARAIADAALGGEGG